MSSARDSQGSSSSGDRLSGDGTPRYRGEKLFSKDTRTVRVALPGIGPNTPPSAKTTPTKPTNIPPRSTGQPISGQPSGLSNPSAARSLNLELHKQHAPLAEKESPGDPDYDDPDYDDPDYDDPDYDDVHDATNGHSLSVSRPADDSTKRFCEQAQRLRQEEERKVKDEHERLDDIVRMCEQYQQQQLAEDRADMYGQPSTRAPLLKTAVNQTMSTPDRTRSSPDRSMLIDRTRSLPVDTNKSPHSSVRSDGMSRLAPSLHISSVQSTRSGPSPVQHKSPLKLDSIRQPSCQPLPDVTYTSSNSPQKQPDIAAQKAPCGIKEQAISGLSRPFSSRTSRLSTDFDAVIRDLCTSRDSREQRVQLEGARSDAMTAIARARQAISEIETQQSEAFRELEVEKNLLNGEEKTEMTSLAGERQSLHCLQQQQLLAIDHMVQQRSSDVLRLEQSRLRLVELETELNEARREGADVRELSEAVESQRRLYEDLEFQQLENEAKHEEDRERLEQQLMSYQEALLQRHKQIGSRLDSLQSQQVILTEQVRAEVSRLERQRFSLLDVLRKEKNKLAAIDRKLAALPAVDSPHNSQGESSSADDVTSSRPESSSSRSPGLVVSPSRPTDSQQSDSTPGDQRPWSTDERSSFPLSSEDTASSRGVSVSSSDDNSSPWKPQSRPMTRYLPVLGHSFDLRSHIESNGHDIDACSHVILNVTSCRGYLYKQGKTIKVWKKRWFVFDRDSRSLVYYTDKSEQRRKGYIIFQAIQDVYRDIAGGSAPAEQHALCIKTYERTIKCRAPSEVALRIWLDAVATGAEAHPDFLRNSVYSNDVDV